MAVVKNYQEIEPQQMLQGVSMRVVIGPDDSAPIFNMRIFEVDPGASTPHHTHWWEHEVFILSGTGEVKTESGLKQIEPGTVILIHGNKKHQFINTGNDTLKFICVVPQEWLKDKKTQGELSNH